MGIVELAKFLDPIQLALALLCGLIAWYTLKHRWQRNLPPGPTGLPLIGYIPFLGKNPAETYMKLKHKYGPVMSVPVGNQSWIILSGYDIIHEALVKRSDIFTGRPTMFDSFYQGYGVVTAGDTPVWKELRKFGIRTLRGFGVGKKSMEQNIAEESRFLLENLLGRDRDVTLKIKLNLAVSNIISRVVFGFRFAYDDERFLRLTQIVREFFADTPRARISSLMVFAPFLRHLPVFRGIRKFMDNELRTLFDILQDIVVEHKSTFHEDDLRDFIDAFLKEINQRDANHPTYSDKQLLHYIKELFEAGTDTTSTTLAWAILCFAHYPQYQEKIAAEITDVIGPTGTPTMSHRDQMPYTCAFIQELMRHRTLVPMGVFRKAKEDCMLGGYFIPKNSTVCPSIWSIHNDPAIFKNPETFRPERFLDSNGKFLLSNYVIPFSIGPRICLGEQLAKMEVFIFLTSIVQNLRVCPDPCKPLPAFEDGSCHMAVYEVPDFNVLFERR